MYLIKLDEALPLAMGDRFILRDSGRQTVVGGGRVLDPTVTNRLATDQLTELADALDSSNNAKATALLSVRGVAGLRELEVASGGGAPTTGLRAGSVVLSDSAARQIRATTIETISGYHALHPLRPGIPKAELASRVNASLDIIDAIVDSDDSVVEADGFVRSIGFSNDLPPELEDRWSKVREKLEKSFDVPRMSAIDLEDEAIHALLRTGDLVQIGPDLVFTANQVDEMHSRVSDLPNDFSVAQFRDEFEMTRRQAVPTLEWLDKSGWTRRTGDGRTVRRRS